MVLLEKTISIINSGLDCMSYKQLTWYGYLQRMNFSKAISNNFGIVSTWKKKKNSKKNQNKKGKTSKFVDAGSNN